MSDLQAARKLVETHSMDQLLSNYRNATTWGTVGACITGIASFLTINDLSGGWGANFDFSFAGTEPYQYFLTGTAIAISAFIAFLQKDSSSESTGNKLALTMLFAVSAINIASDASNYAMRTEKQMTRVSLESEEYKKSEQLLDRLVNTSSAGIATSPALTHALEKLAYHQGELAICKTKYEGKPKRIKRCEDYEQNKVNTYQARVEAQKQAATQAAEATTKQQEQLLQFGFQTMQAAGKNEENYPPIVRFIQDFASQSAFYANVLISLFLTMVVLLGIFYAGQKKRLNELALRLLGVDGNGQALQHPEAANDATVAKTTPRPTPSNTSYQSNFGAKFTNTVGQNNTNAVAQPHSFTPNLNANMPHAFVGNAALDTAAYTQPQQTAEVIQMDSKRVQPIEEGNQIDLEDIVTPGQMSAANDSPTVSLQSEQCVDTLVNTDTLDTEQETQTGAVNALINAHDSGELKKWSIRACTKVIRGAGIRGNDEVMRFIINEVAEPHFIEYGRAKLNPNWVKGGHNRVILLAPKS